jgi:hypothetical protein
MPVPVEEPEIVKRRPATAQIANALRTMASAETKDPCTTDEGSLDTNLGDVQLRMMCVSGLRVTTRH